MNATGSDQQHQPQQQQHQQQLWKVDRSSIGGRGEGKTTMTISGSIRPTILAMAIMLILFFACQVHPILLQSISDTTMVASTATATATTTTTSDTAAAAAADASAAPSTAPVPQPVQMVTKIVKVGYVPYEKIIGHVHMAKTAGTEINGELAVHFERVCGHKGYTYDFVKFNQNTQEIQLKRGCDDLETCVKPDLVSRSKRGYNRGRVPYEVMKDEIGWDNCDYISIERGSWEWNGIASQVPLEIHVPCRDPITHLMSQCNYVNHTFTCYDDNDDDDNDNNNMLKLEKEVQACMIHEERFKSNLLENPNITLKCFDPIPIEPYIEYMSGILQRRRFETDYTHRSSNTVRNVSDECIWNNPSVRAKVKDILLKKPYYHYCDQCVGTSDDLLANRTSI